MGYRYRDERTHIHNIIRPQTPFPSRDIREFQLRTLDDLCLVRALKPWSLKSRRPIPAIIWFSSYRVRLDTLTLMFFQCTSFEVWFPRATVYENTLTSHLFDRHCPVSNLGRIIIFSLRSPRLVEWRSGSLGCPESLDVCLSTTWMGPPWWILSIYQP